MPMHANHDVSLGHATWIRDEESYTVICHLIYAEVLL